MKIYYALKVGPLLLLRMKNFVKRFLPGGLRHTAEIYGVGETFLWILRTAWSYKRIIMYLLSRDEIELSLP